MPRKKPIPETIKRRKPSLAPVEEPLTAPEPAPADITLHEPPPAPFPVIGLGTSAGGLAAFEAFFSAMPENTPVGMAFVLVQHLAPDHKSILADLVQRYTTMPVFEVQDGTKVQPNHVYIIPPNHDMAYINGSLQLLEPSETRGIRLPIDFFFRSLASDLHDSAICIVLSGTGSDGTLGVRAVKGEGGMVMAQNPESTEYDGMPRSAIATGLVDYVLPPAEMPAQLMAYADHAFGKKIRPILTLSPKAHDVMKKIHVLLRSHTGHDFSQYKENTVIRRMERRMALHQIEKQEDYLSYLQKNKLEIEAFFRDLLIGVTNFFRDPDAFASLETQVIPRLFAGKPVGAPVRVWVCGCSTGEEAYSIAILIYEYMEGLRQTFKIQIFATDIDARAVDQARSGIFPASIAADVSPERLARFFTPDAQSGDYRIQKSIRDMMVSSEQDVINDPPFSRLDLISCRNLLIYMNGDLQKKLMPMFHYALNPYGILFLGTSETVGDYGTLFEPLDRKWKTYLRRQNISGVERPALGNFVLPVAETASFKTRRLASPGDGKLTLKTLTEQALLKHFVAAGVLVTRRGEILHIYGRTGHYLEPAPGDADMNILNMAREGLRRELTNALHRAVTRQEPAHLNGLKVRTNGHSVRINLSVHPVDAEPNAPETAALFLVIFEETPEPVTAPKAPETPDQAACANADAACIASLEQELRSKEAYLQATLEEMETTNEELKSANEELQSVNEELQSSNEELETSKEELQSVNEELATVNAELQAKVTDLSRANNDMNNLLAGTGIGTIFVDHHLRISRFTPEATKLVNLIPTDVGRPVGHVVSNLKGYATFVEDVQAVLDHLVPREVEVQTREGAWYLMNIRPYRTLENVIEGAVITFVDITARKKLETRARLAVILQDAGEAITLQDPDGSILAWNRGAEKMYGFGEAEALQMSIYDTVPEDKKEEYIQIMNRIKNGEIVSPFDTGRKTKDGRILNVRLTAARLTDDAGQNVFITTTERNIVDHAATQTKNPKTKKKTS